MLLLKDCFWIGFYKKITFDAYNAKKDIPELLIVHSHEEDVVQKFKETIIYKEIIEAEINKNVFTKWVDSMVNSKWDEKVESENEEKKFADE